jgi:large subunit ribosomal protein L20
MRSKGGTTHRRRANNVLKRTKGFRGARSKLYRTAKNAMIKSLQYAYTGRKLKKRTFRQLWIARINAGCRAEGISYSRFINGLKKSGIELNRKVLSNLAITDTVAFAKLCDIAKKAK